MSNARGLRDGGSEDAVAPKPIHTSRVFHTQVKEVQARASKSQGLFPQIASTLRQEPPTSELVEAIVER